MNLWKDRLQQIADNENANDNMKNSKIYGNKAPFPKPTTKKGGGCKTCGGKKVK